MPAILEETVVLDSDEEPAAPRHIGAAAAPMDGQDTLPFCPDTQMVASILTTEEEKYMREALKEESVENIENEESVATTENPIEEPIAATTENHIEEPTETTTNQIEEMIAAIDNDEPVAAIENQIEEPIATAENQIEEPIATAENQIEEPIATIENQIEEPAGVSSSASAVPGPLVDASEESGFMELSPPEKAAYMCRCCVFCTIHMICVNNCMVVVFEASNPTGADSC